MVSGTYDALDIGSYAMIDNAGQENGKVQETGLSPTSLNML